MFILTCLNYRNNFEVLDHLPKKEKIIKTTKPNLQQHYINNRLHLQRTVPIYNIKKSYKLNKNLKQHWNYERQWVSFEVVSMHEQIPWGHGTWYR